MNEKIKIKCPRCQHEQEYKPIRIPKRPKAKCLNCGRYIYNISLRSIQDYLTVNKIDHSSDHLLNIRPSSDHLVKIDALKCLNMGMYASQIAKKWNYHQMVIFRIIRGFERKKLIVLINKKPKIPKLYNLTKKGKELLQANNLLIKKEPTKKAEETPQNATTFSEELWPYGLIEIGMHSLRYKQPLINKPSWLYRFTSLSKYNGFLVSRTPMQNWDKFFLRGFDYMDYNGLHNIEICNNVVIYNFKLKRSDEWSKSVEDLIEFKKNRIDGCIRAGKKLEQNGFGLGLPQEIELAQKPHFVIKTENGVKHDRIGELLIATISDGNMEITYDHSGKKDGEDGEVELVNGKEEDIRDLLDAPKKVENIEKMFDQINVSLNQLRQQQSQTSQAIKQTVMALGQITQVLSNMQVGYKDQFN